MNTVNIIAALLAPVVAAVGLRYAHVQAKTNRDRLKLELFDRRYALFEHARKLIGHVLAKAGVDDDHIHEFIISTIDVDFLLGNDVTDYFNELKNCALELRTLEAELEGLQPGDEKQAKNRAKWQKVRWFSGQPEVLREKFRPYLELPRP